MNNARHVGKLANMCLLCRPYPGSIGFGGGFVGFLFEKLDVYQKALALVDKVTVLTRQFPRGQSVLADQLKRAAISVPLNIAEGSGRWHKSEKRQFYFISRGSAFECVAAAEICARQSLIDGRQHAEVRADVEALCQMLTKLIQSAA